MRAGCRAGIVPEDEGQWTSAHVGAMALPARKLIGPGEEEYSAGEEGSQRGAASPTCHCAKTEYPSHITMPSAHQTIR
jgi:hypothetical protein